MRYLIINLKEKPFLTNWFEPENHFIIGMVVFDLLEDKYTMSGELWHDIEIDHL